MEIQPFPSGRVNAEGDNPINEPQDMNDNIREFVYRSNFDEEGALFYLGTFGKTKSYQNPHTAG